MCRPFLLETISTSIAKPRGPYSALEMSTKAARVCAAIMKTQLDRKQNLLSFHELAATCQVCCAALLVNIWDLKSKDEGRTQVKEPGIEPVTVGLLLADVETFLDALAWAGQRYEVATRVL